MTNGLAKFTLRPLAAGCDLTLLALRLVTGSFLIHEVWDNIVSPERMQEFVAFMEHFGFGNPAFWAPFSVWAQFICGVLLVLGLFTRAAGIVIAINFVVAVMMVHWAEDFRGWWPALVLVFLGLHFATAGSGRYGLDRIIGGKQER